MAGLVIRSPIYLPTLQRQQQAGKESASPSVSGRRAKGAEGLGPSVLQCDDSVHHNQTQSPHPRTGFTTEHPGEEQHEVRPFKVLEVRVAHGWVSGTSLVRGLRGPSVTALSTEAQL